jgi:hypothetical protein
MSETLLPVSEGLRRCPTCGEFEGTGLKLMPPDRTEWGVVTVTCICDGGVRRRCGNRQHRPISNYFDEQDGIVWHAPWFGGQIPCRQRGTNDWQWAKS